MSSFRSGVLNICLCRGVDRKVIASSKRHGPWTAGRAVMTDMSKNKQFDVFFAPGVPASGTDAPGDQFALLVKPRRQYHDAKFEELFNFGIGGRGYTTNRTIGIRARSVTVE